MSRRVDFFVVWYVCMCMGHYDPSAPDVPVLHTGEFVLTHVLKVAESLARRGCEVFIISRRMRGQRKYERISERIVTGRIYRG
ncbi:MAG: hypothetical protein OCU22_08670 [Canidatus Methanoxibalbensis ujae]|nr:hypothetical protein [Candidatus Methanoxibalbensis ujae]